MKKQLEAIKSYGGRLTKNKLAILKILNESGCLLSQKKITQLLKMKGFFPNRSTVYRELLTLEEHGIIRKSLILGSVYYELNGERHHHHLICLTCSQISAVEMRNHLVFQEKQIEKTQGFKIKNHSLEFYGYCKKCNN